MNKFFSFTLSRSLSLCLLILGIMLGCTSFEEQRRAAECKARNSHTDGFNDAMNGHKKSHFHIYNNKCSQYGVSLNRQLYIKGYTKGIKAFCTHKGGYELALKGKKYKKNCSTKEEKFLKGYHEGDKKCLYEAGYSQANQGQASSFSSVKCLKLSKDQSEKEYSKGWTAGLKVFCSYDKGHRFGLHAKPYLEICPKDNSVDFYKGYKAGDAKCLYEIGHSQAVNGEKPSFSTITNCLKLSKTQSPKEYLKGRRAGLKVFCTYDKGHKFGLKGKKYLYICPKKNSEAFLKGYRAGDRKCLYEAGYYYAIRGRQKAALSSILCLKLSKTHSNKQYLKGWNAGLKAFCTYKEGYNLGLNNGHYENTCPKNLEANFFKGYTLGLQEYKKDQRQQELLAIEQKKIAVERERTQQMMAIEQEKIEAERERTQQLVDIEEQRIEQQERVRKDILNSQRQKCAYSSDCQEGGYCEYNYHLGYDVCQYD